MTEALYVVLERCLSLLEEGASRPSSVWHTPTLATLDSSGMPKQRTVVLRSFNRSQRLAEIHTDRRSAKWEELRMFPNASLHIWDAVRRIQLRTEGVTELHTGNNISQAAWDSLTPQTRSTYEVSPGPGAFIAFPNELTARDEQAAQDDFCVIRMSIRSMELLSLERPRHTRARFTWAADTCQSVWLVP